MALDPIETFALVPWTDLANTSYLNGVVEKVGGSSSVWDAGAYCPSSVATITSLGGSFKFQTAQKDKAVMIGLSADPLDISYTSLDYAFYFVESGNFQIYENGTMRGSFGAYETSDVFEVKVQTDVIQYLKNDVVIYTSTIAPTYPLSPDSTLLHLNSKFTNTYIRYWFSPMEPTQSTKCVVYAFLKDFLDATPQVESSFIIELKEKFTYGQKVIAPFKKSVRFDEKGYAALSVIETESVGAKYAISIEYKDGKDLKTLILGEKIIPKSPAILVTQLS